MHRIKGFFVFFSILLISCQSNKNSSFDNEYGASFDEGSILERPLPDSRGIITYENYQILVAKGNETVEEVGKRLNIDPERLASYNGVLLNYLPRENEVLALPIKIAGEVVGSFSEWNIQDSKKSIENADSRISNLGTPSNPIKHRVETGDTAYSIARLYNVSVTSLAKWNGLDADLNIIEGRELIIPVILKRKENDTPKNKKKSNNKVDNKEQNLTPSLKEGIKETDQLDIGSTSNEIIDEKKIIKPVDGIILRKYNPTSLNNKNEGVDFFALPGTPIKSSAAGVVALISEPVGGLGKIILIKHKDSVISIYGRVKNVKVNKGQRVTAGQIIGEVEKSSLNDNTKNYLHFELRKGTESLDPEPLFK